MARPKKAAVRLRARIVAFRVTEAEYAQLRATAEKAGLPVNELARIAALSSGGRIVIETYATNDPALLKRLDRIANNLNQLTKNAHIFGRVSPKVEELCELIADIVHEAAEKEWNR